MLFLGLQDRSHQANKQMREPSDKEREKEKIKKKHTKNIEKCS